MARILFATIGSLGDLHPCLALGTALLRRGHQVTVATTPAYRAKIEALGLRFHPMRPDWQPDDREMIRQCEDLRRGTEILIRKLLLPHLRDTYADLLEAAKSADLMIAGEIVYAAPLVAETLGLRWLSAILSPSSFFSAYDPSLLAPAPGLLRLRRRGWRINRAVLELIRLASRPWWQPVRALRRELGLRVACDPLQTDKFSRFGVLALFSRHFAGPQPDWPPHTVQPGFLFYDGAGEREELSPELREFLQAGEAPLVFTLGSTVSSNPGNFFPASAAAAQRLGRRAVLLGAEPPDFAPSPGLFYARYAPYSLIFPRASAVVHQGGSGTTAQALRAGRPMLVVPYAWDQPDNGARIERLGAGLVLARRNYSAAAAAAALTQLLEKSRFTARAEMLAAQIQDEAGLQGACDVVETLLSRASSGTAS